MAYDEEVFGSEFAHPQGSTYTLLPLPASRLMRLRDLPEPAAA